MDVLNEMAAHARERVEAAKLEKSLDDVSYEATVVANNAKANAYVTRGGAAAVRGVGTPRGPLFRFGQAIKNDEFAIICEIKKASPSAGLIDRQFNYQKIAEECDRAQATCISCPTEPTKFMGSDEIFSEMRAAVEAPMLRKDIVVDEYQIYESRLLGAEAVPLNCACLDCTTIKHLIGVCDLLAMDAVVEACSKDEVEIALEAGARIVCVRNTILENAGVDFESMRRLAELISDDCLLVAEGGVKTVDDIAAFATMGIDGVIVGEALMRDRFKGRMIAQFRAAAKRAQTEAKARAAELCKPFCHGFNPPPLPPVAAVAPPAPGTAVPPAPPASHVPPAPPVMSAPPAPPAAPDPAPVASGAGFAAVASEAARAANRARAGFAPTPTNPDLTL